MATSPSAMEGASLPQGPRITTDLSSSPPATVRPHAGSLSDSSEEGFHLSPAAARRFARRNMRRTSPTPDLVTSLVRPPSPEAFYIAPQIHDRVRADIRARLDRQRSLRSRAGPSSGRKIGPSLPPHMSSLDIPRKYGGDCVFDMYSLTYVDEVDVNLLCPICHDPLVDPVSTPCDHTFCYRCLRRSLTSSPSGMACPIDRDTLQWFECKSAGRLIRTQLGSLMVFCPNQQSGCQTQHRREAVESHVQTKCDFKEFACPGKGCDKKVSVAPMSDECRHNEVNCEFCDETVFEADTETHKLACSKSKTRCESCWQLVVRSQMTVHFEIDCDGVEIECLYSDLGCSEKVLRGQLGSHALSCAFHPDTPSGAVIRAQRDVIESNNEMDKRLRELASRQEDLDRQLREMVPSRSQPSDRRSSVIDDNRTMQDLDAGFEEIHQNLTHLEARQSMWTLNQVMPIREEVTELRNNINMIRMHVNWLLNRSREEGRIRAANGTSTTSTIRRDSSGEPIPAMPERRRSSGNEADLPRL